MGVNVYCWLPSDVCVDDVTEVIGKLLGKESIREPLTRNQSTGWYLRVPDARAGNTSILGMVNIVVKPPVLTREDWGFTCSYFFESGSIRNPGEKTVYLGGGGLHIAVAIGLAKFFGGRVDFDDCDDKTCDRHYPKPRKTNRPKDGKAWQDFEAAKDAVKPLTLAQIQKCAKWSAYKEV